MVAVDAMMVAVVHAFVVRTVPVAEGIPVCTVCIVRAWYEVEGMLSRFGLSRIALIRM